MPLDDMVGANPRVVFCGMSAAESTHEREHYYETPGNNFWEMLHESGLTPVRLGPQDDHTLPQLGLGLTDLVSHDVEALAAKVARWRPEWIAFTSKTTAHAVARALGERRPGLGPAPWDFAGAAVFVLPGTSGANRRRDYDGRPGRLPWWRDLAMLAA
jgi:TDG/mug DNA glycosylase family protein